MTQGSIFGFVSMILLLFLLIQESLVSITHLYNTHCFLEFIPDTISLDGLKKNVKNYTSLFDFYNNTFDYDFEEAQKNFTESLAAYSLIQYIL